MSSVYAHVFTIMHMHDTLQHDVCTKQHMACAHAICANTHGICVHTCDLCAHTCPWEPYIPPSLSPVAEQVLQREHHLQGEELLLVPHYDVLEPELLSRCPAEDSNQRAVGPGLTGTTEGTGTVSLGPEEGSETPRAAKPLDQERPVGIPLSSGACLESPAQRRGPSSRAAECFEQVGQVEKQLSMEPGALRFLQLHYGDLLAGLGDVGLVPCEGPEFSGFQVSDQAPVLAIPFSHLSPVAHGILCRPGAPKAPPVIPQIYGAPGPCQAAEEFLQSLLGSVSCHTLSLGHPGSANFLLSPDGQNLLQDLEARFLCVFGTEHLTMATLGIESTEVQPELPLLPFRSLGGPGDSDSLPSRWTPRRPSLTQHGHQKTQVAVRRT